jgi:hypothetical protein
MPRSMIEGTGDGPTTTTTGLAEARVDAAEVVVEVSGLRMSYDGFEAVRGIDLRTSRGRSSPSSVPTARGRRPPSKSSRAIANAPSATARCSAATPSAPIAGGGRGLGWCSKPRESSRSSPCESAWSCMPGITGAALGAGRDRARRPGVALGGALWAAFRWPAAASRRRPGVDRRPRAGVPQRADPGL